ncbi:hypothetical protein DL764_001930 [Monosporascus ibericus]|uniref:Decapping nuclease n=1 Tax=Monosporascus ibericus TaxID=155417 RepID=A0A4Q4TMF9_9PEZI|nr:hypothetical protein DL764_001930 [Monosporascus ibericus]
MGEEVAPRYTTWKPIFQAVEAMMPDFHFDDIDIMARGAVLQELLTFIKGRPRRLNYLVYLIGNTLVFEIYRRRPMRKRSSEARRRDIGLDFQCEYTRWPEGLEDSLSHIRVVTYRLGHLNCVVTVGIDACFQVKFGKREAVFARDSNIHSEPVAGAVTVVTRGFNDDLPAIEMKTGQGLRRSIEQMWFSRVPYIVRPRLDPWTEHALVRAVNVKMVAPICRTWEEVEENQNDLRKLTALISQLREIVRGTEGKCCFIARVGGSPDLLHIFAMEEGIMPVSERDIQKFWPNRHQ